MEEEEEAENEKKSGVYFFNKIPVASAANGEEEFDKLTLVSHKKTIKCNNTKSRQKIYFLLINSANLSPKSRLDIIWKKKQRHIAQGGEKEEEDGGKEK